MAESIMQINSANFDEKISSEKPILVDFWASWCGPCKLLGPVLDEVAGEVSDIDFAKINVDENEDIAVRFRVMSIPTIVMFKEGKEVARSVGFKNKQQILNFIQENK